MKALGTLHRACSALFITAKRTSMRPFQKAERLGANRPFRPFSAPAARIPASSAVACLSISFILNVLGILHPGFQETARDAAPVIFRPGTLEKTLYGFFAGLGERFVIGHITHPEPKHAQHRFIICGLAGSLGIGWRSALTDNPVRP